MMAKLERSPQQARMEACLLYTSKVLPHGGKEIQHHAALQTDTAVHDAVLLEQGIAGA